MQKSEEKIVSTTRKRYKPILLVIVILLFAAAPSVYFYLKYKSSQELLKNPAQVSKQETDDLVKSVLKIMDLPKDEIPTIATVSDAKKLESQSFFTKAKNGDKVLIYSKSGKAILYRPSIHKVIDVTPINITESTATSSGSITPSPSVSETNDTKIVLFNGTKTIGLTSNAEKALTSSIPDISILDKDNAKLDTYEKSVVVDVSKKIPEMAQKIANELNISVGSLPEGESVPAGADILVILGSDFK